jgi:LmbE family N-acetylglucosaminyl deacetylase
MNHTNPIGPVVVSPHLDDAALSAAVQLMRPGACAITVFAGRPPAGTSLGSWDRLTGATDARQRVEDRWLEDEEALSVLGLRDPVRLDFLDGQHLAETPRRPDVHAVTEALRRHLAGVREVWVPAAIGGHPDHLAARDAAVASAEPGAVIHHYADMPYSVPYGWPPSVDGSTPWSPYLDVEQWLTDELADVGLDEASLVRSVHRLEEEAQRRKVKAMASYRTQIPAIDHGGALADGNPAILGFEISWTRR